MARKKKVDPKARTTRLFNILLVFLVVAYIFCLLHKEGKRKSNTISNLSDFEVLVENYYPLLKFPFEVSARELKEKTANGFAGKISLLETFERGYLVYLMTPERLIAYRKQFGNQPIEAQIQFFPVGALPTSLPNHTILIHAERHLQTGQIEYFLNVFDAENGRLKETLSIANYEQKGDSTLVKRCIIEEDLLISLEEILQQEGENPFLKQETYQIKESERGQILLEFIG